MRRARLVGSQCIRGGSASEEHSTSREPGPAKGTHLISALDLSAVAPALGALADGSLSVTITIFLDNDAAFQVDTERGPQSLSSKSSRGSILASCSVKLAKCSARKGQSRGQPGRRSEQVEISGGETLLSLSPAKGIFSHASRIFAQQRIRQKTPSPPPLSLGAMNRLFIKASGAVREGI